MNQRRNGGHRGSAPNQKLSRRKLLKVSLAGAIAASTGVLASCMTSPSSPAARVGTTPKREARYQDSPNRGRRCGGCTHFMEPNACEIVAGEISPNGWCRFHQPKPA
ncbi:twin-arginine translocation signal domain-containing protein [Rhizobium sp. CBN3]|uniref:twin-arginine translocation signal domain-containing protein n=1 Tax=Rhizobium sp. CBN3 TaxID=3058045 RepID=UPI0026723546|nr:twin-arginine translocation signal domain-containing protein [Rhizobium sp. CBN3]MDO3434540.1 twin-arginine translocation signal domain-containing protein [Rhizobium sp. CBN3]